MYPVTLCCLLSFLLRQSGLFSFLLRFCLRLGSYFMDWVELVVDADGENVVIVVGHHKLISSHVIKQSPVVIELPWAGIVGSEE